MSTSSQSFEQVRSILSKLDRDIEAARNRRLGGPVAERSFGTPPAARPQPAPASHAATPSSLPEAPRPPQPGRSGYGVARPLRRDS